MDNTTRRHRRQCPRRRDEHGAGGVEFLMMATVLMLLFTTLVQYGINLYASRVAEAAAREGAVEAASFDGTSGAGSSTAKEYLGQTGSPAIRGSSVSASRSGTQARVTVTVQVATVLPWISDPITSTATVPVERWVE